MTSKDEKYMAQALALGRRGMGQTWPNPAVGCLLIKNDRVVGRGWTQPGGRPHAERVALDMAGEAARGATAYVTLEPCSHHGKTPPCCDALIAAGVARVVSPISDKDPRVAGQGFQRLREAGIQVETGIRAEEAYHDHAGFFMRFTQERPWVTLKLALSLDGRIATATGESQWITGPQARRKVHALRAKHDAVLVGGGTARADNPALTVRGLGERRQPVRVVFSRSLDLPLTGQLAQTAGEIPVWLCHGPNVDAQVARSWEEAGAKLLSSGLSGRQVNPTQALATLAEQGLTRVFCEGGGSLASSLLINDLVDELHVFSAGVALGAEGFPGIGGLGIEELASAPRFELSDLSMASGDVHHVWRRK
ncbi:MAG: bifunctional diaminohydroxyphosphoribosylaminopyrimidine deaminase/5-amino-6-(5-phosphoribosylamino)uracil reductase RibD [Pelagimonas sp.]|nr:bifunctional diaminohydroxyphosphoribosylaminopyrimidine deaminase/5-amino-6-(5-phosphoribosylamino)uracil reductase RibD [Pelagimonas sp.]